MLFQFSVFFSVAVTVTVIVKVYNFHTARTVSAFMRFQTEATSVTHYSAVKAAFYTAVPLPIAFVRTQITCNPNISD